MNPKPFFAIRQTRNLNKTASIFLLLAFVVFNLQANQVQADTRVALVIANADYGKFGKLKTPIRDASLVAAKLRTLGFQVQRGNNLNRREFTKTLRDFLRAARLADKALIYYSGNQLTLNDKMYLVPVNEAPTTVNQALLGLVSVEAILRRFDTAAAENFLILEGGWKTGVVANLGGNLSSGDVTSLRSAQTALTAPKNSILSLATSGDKLNPRERGNSSRFTTALVKNLDQRGKTLLAMLRQTIADVTESTKGEQIPSVFGSLEKPVYLAGRPLVVPREDGKVEEARLRWAEIKGSNLLDEFEAFLAEFGATPYAGPAMNRLHKLQSEDPEHLKRLREQTLERRAMVKALEVEREKKKVISERLNRSPYPLRVHLQPFRIKGNVSVRAAPQSDGGWLGVLEKGEQREVIGQVIGRNWMQVEWRPATAEKPPVFGYFFARNAEAIGVVEADIWASVKKSPSEATLRAYLELFPEGYHRYDVTKMLLEMLYPEAAIDNEIDNLGFVEAEGDLKGLELSAEELPKGRYSASEASVQSTTRRRQGGVEIQRIPEMGYTLKVFEDEYIVKQRANLRRLPWVKTRRMGIADRDQKIVVTGEVVEAPWYRVKFGGGRDLYVHADLIEPFASSDFAVWQEVKASGDLSDLRFYLQSFPKGRFAKTANQMLAALQSESGEGSERQLVLPKSVATLNLENTATTRRVNVQPIEFDGQNSVTLSSKLSAQLGRSLQANVSQQENKPNDAFMNVVGRILRVTVTGDEASTIKPLDLLLGDRDGRDEADEGPQNVDYYVVVELGATVEGFEFPIVSIQENTLSLPPDVNQRVAVQLALKDAFKAAADDIVIKLANVL